MSFIERQNEFKFHSYRKEKKDILPEESTQNNASI